jgi:SOS-response transcriptional repressor LexA
LYSKEDGVASPPLVQEINDAHQLCFFIFSLSCIYSGDVIAVYRAVTATHNKIIVARLGEDFTVKRLQVIKGSTRIFLKPENPKYQLMEVTHRNDFEIWSCVT